MKKRRMRSIRTGASHPHLKRQHMSTMGKSAFAPPGDPGMAFSPPVPPGGAMAAPPAPPGPPGGGAPMPPGAPGVPGL